MTTPAPSPIASKEDRHFAVFLHLAPLAALLLGHFLLHTLALNIAVSVLLWLIGKKRGAFIDQCGRNALNFQLTLLLYFGLYLWIGMTLEKIYAKNEGYFLVELGLMRLIAGSYMMLAVIGAVASLGIMITAARKARAGIAWEYPFAVGFMRLPPSPEADQA